MDLGGMFARRRIRGVTSSLADLDLYNLSPNISLAFNISPGWIPPFKLRYLKTRSCQLGPEFPTWLRNQNDLKTVVLNNAKISGTIPDWFFQLNLQLDELDVGDNRLTGEPPTSLMFVDDQSNVDLSSNLYEGPLPMWSSNVTTLYLNDNRFSGPIPPNIGELMPYLTDLDLSRNDLNGTIPLSIGNMTSLTTLVISNNYLSGEIPRFWSNLSLLFILDMSNNSLSGPIPSENKFLGNIPAWIAESIPSLLILRLRSNSFTGEIPPQICQLSNLHLVDLSHNRLSGSIPPCIGNLTGLKVELTDADTERYQGRLTVVAKGRFVQYDQSILYLVNSLDLSDNPGDEKQQQSPDNGGRNGESEDGGDDLEYFWLILSIGLGFFVGFWGVCGTLIIKKSWREAYYGYVDRMKNKLAALIACRMD
ncbi:receptor-like protein EIX2 [Syzygium oleosum]|uniref:receptor-like protein EIX2 n=1 Tax=Syzygium oleosum TaxID=219896 RepID=UPI0024BAFC6E|nr:receptor-like protein EIX2 [Syzygium oleosum]